MERKEVCKYLEIASNLVKETEVKWMLNQGQLTLLSLSDKISYRTIPDAYY